MIAALLSQSKVVGDVGEKPMWDKRVRSQITPFGQYISEKHGLPKNIGPET